MHAQKAFDTVWHAGLFSKLYNKGVRGEIWRLIHHWYPSSLTSILHPGTGSAPSGKNTVSAPILVDDLLENLSACGEVSHIITTGSPVHACMLMTVRGQSE